MANHEIEDEQITASSSIDPHFPFHARLNNTDNFWRPNYEDQEPWIQVGFLNQIVKIFEIMTRGYSNMNNIEKFTVSYSNDGLRFAQYKENGIEKVQIYSKKKITNSR